MAAKMTTGDKLLCTEIGEIEIERETSALQHGTDSSKQMNKLSRKTCETAGGDEVDCTSGTHGSSTLPFTRSFRTCEADKETVEGDTGGNDHPQQQHKHHESVRQRPSTGWRGIQAATFIPTPPRDMDERPGEGGSESSPSPLTHMAPPKLSPQQGGGGLGENPSDLSPERDSGLRLNESVPEPSFDRVEGDTGGNDHPQQQHKHHESVRQPSFDRVEGDTGCYIHSQHPKTCAMPKALGFTDKTKGYFPHKFSSEIHLNYVGPYPVPSDYGVDHMTVREREEFDPWYNEVSRGHPVIIYKDFEDPRSYYGFIRATVYPPRGLLFPVLPHKSEGGKLLFTLCRTCAETNNEGGPCEHDDEGRALTGVWVTVEFIKALEVGYRVGKITEVWHFDKSSDTVFTDYIHTFLKGKQEASGYPAEATDRESRKKYIRDYQEHQGILLDAGKIETNPVKRQVAKLCQQFVGKVCTER
ncbi:hypothetical protein D4764_07G0000930 [Takifugu flavidus]|uniref:DNA-directed DNA polymerase n=1 Tax=Takifugu flavidus TaxID=433684 RepID=A0A5C6MQ09_9TELE|nr:hypothetical protein D4764_07G0000930 [Takifugu flavidus]